MELTLNLGWTAMTLAMGWLWAHHARREGQGRWRQFVSFALILVIMFGVITVYDDMAMAQNPAETRCFQREDDLGAHEHAQLHPVIASIPTPAAELPCNAFFSAMPGKFLVPTVKLHALSSIQNRPPPAA
jgi:hypothetical protein